jgi:hypothetical protein
VGRCDLELDLGTKLGLGRPKHKISQNGFKTDVCVGLVDTNPTQLEWAQTDVICSRYHDLFIFPNKQKVNRQKVNVDVSMTS